MLRFRRYRVLLVAAVFSLLAFYRLSLSNSLYRLPYSADGRFRTPVTTQPAQPPAGQPNGADTKADSPPIANFDKTALGSTAPEPASTAEVKSDERKDAATSAQVGTDTSFALPQQTEVPGTAIKQGATAPASLPTPIGTDRPKIGDGPIHKDDRFAEGGQAKLEVPPPLSDKPPLHWSRMPEHFPVPTESIIPLPSGKPVALPKIQHTFTAETADAKAAREKKLGAIKEAFKFTWKNYEERAWMHDELRPVTGGWKDPFCSWAATLVDSLDTLHIMGLHDEFAAAVRAVAQIDFTTTPRKDIPVFETVIRYLGGLLGAYDVSGAKHPVLLAKARELADVLMGAFDTPNRMPVTFYYWAPTFAANPHRAGARTVLAELGSLLLEFTRLAQLTREPRYYDTVARITNELELFQNQTLLPGLWPKFVDTSGCKKPPPPEELDTVPVLPKPAAEKPLVAPDDVGQSSSTLSSEDARQATAEPGTESSATTHTTAAAGASTGVPAAEPIDKSSAPLIKRQLDHDADPTGHTTHNSGVHDYKPAPIITEIAAPEKVDCLPQGLAAPPGSNVQFFTMGAMADSTYEYLPKQFLLLGGRLPQYRSMYENAIDAANEHLLFRPMLKDETRSVLSLGTAEAHSLDAPETPGKVRLRPELAHLTCFAGGMWGLGARLFGRDADLSIAKKLADGCVWAYESTATGVMPESFDVLTCASRVGACPWNQTRWEESLDPYREQRESRQAQAEEARQQERVEKQRAEQMHAMTAKAAAWKSAAEANEAAANAAAGADEEPMTLSMKLADVTEAVPLAAHLPTSGPLAKRQLGDAVPNARGLGPEKARADASVASPEALEAGTPATAVPKAEATSAEAPPPASPTPSVPAADTPDLEGQAATPTTPTAASPTPAPIPEDEEPYDPFPSHEEFVRQRILNEGLAPGMTAISSRSYLLRPEAIESVFYMYRLTGDEAWRAKGWRMFEAVRAHAHARYGYAALRDVTLASQRRSHFNQTESIEHNQSDSMESFWLAETLKYFYLLFSGPETVSLDDWVL